MFIQLAFCSFVLSSFSGTGPEKTPLPAVYREMLPLHSGSFRQRFSPGPEAL
jgi:hypothetical protein